MVVTDRFHCTLFFYLCDLWRNLPLHQFQSGYSWHQPATQHSARYILSYDDGRCDDSIVHIRQLIYFHIKLGRSCRNSTLKMVTSLQYHVCEPDQKQQKYHYFIEYFIDKHIQIIRPCYDESKSLLEDDCHNSRTTRWQYISKFLDRSLCNIVIAMKGRKWCGVYLTSKCSRITPAG